MYVPSLILEYDLTVIWIVCEGKVRESYVGHRSCDLKLASAVVLKGLIVEVLVGRCFDLRIDKIDHLDPSLGPESQCTQDCQNCKKSPDFCLKLLFTVAKTKLHFLRENVKFFEKVANAPVLPLLHFTFKNNISS